MIAKISGKQGGEEIFNIGIEAVGTCSMEINAYDIAQAQRHDSFEIFIGNVFYLLWNYVAEARSLFDLAVESPSWVDCDLQFEVLLISERDPERRTIAFDNSIPRLVYVPRHEADQKKVNTVLTDLLREMYTTFSQCRPPQFRD